MAGRLAALPAAQRPVLLAAAVAGDLDWRLLGTVTGLAETTVLGALRSATGVGLLSVPGDPRDGQLRWRHALTRDAVLATLLPPDRAALAARAARALADRGGPDDPAAAAELFVVAGQPERAAELLLALARRDAARGALRSAEESLARAAATGRLVGAVAAERVQVLTMLGQVETGADGLAGAVVGQQHAELCLRLARAAISGGQWTTAEGYLERAGRPADPRSLVLAADAAYGAGDVERATSLATAAVRAAERDCAAPEILCEALTVLANSKFGTDPVGTAAMLRRAAQVAAEHGLTPWRVETLFLLAAQELSGGYPHAPSLGVVRELAAQAGMLAHIVRIDLLSADTVLLVEGSRAARPLAQRVADRAGRLRLPALQAMAELWAAAGAAAAGELTAMTALLNTATQDRRAARRDRAADQRVYRWPGPIRPGRRADTRYALDPAAAVLIRPDGYLAWRGATARALPAAVAGILGWTRDKIELAGAVELGDSGAPCLNGARQNERRDFRPAPVPGRAVSPRLRPPRVAHR
ncbi:MAG TPA: hypothetical protein VFO16_22585 [Pseudonocardiaceae bacterium]|nr:hypothetical protein [Pseudonocardiaceae bacterium]